MYAYQPLSWKCRVVCGLVAVIACAGLLGGELGLFSAVANTPHETMARAKPVAPETKVVVSDPRKAPGG